MKFKAAQRRGWVHHGASQQLSGKGEKTKVRATDTPRPEPCPLLHCPAAMWLSADPGVLIPIAGCQ